MRRREFIALLGGGAATWPLAARAQQSTLPVIGILSARSPDTDAALLRVFRRGLEESGFVEGRNVTFDYRPANGQYDQLSALAAGLVSSDVSVIVAIAGSRSLPAAKNATSSIPILFIMAGDPVKLGFVASLSRPGGNITGVTMSYTEAAPKRLGLLFQLLPTAKTIAILANPQCEPETESEIKVIGEAANAIGRQIVALQASDDAELDAASAKLGQIKPDALLVSSDPFLFTRAGRLVQLAANHALPTLYYRREFADAGGLLSYGSDPDEAYHTLGLYAGRVLKGEKPADLPVFQPTKFELVINLKTARALGLTIPPGVLAIANTVIE
jgi:putative tryptophan/tyrosine transport system substrate-binding protein